MENENIDEILKDEVEKAKEAKLVKLPPEIKRQSEASHKISNFIIQAIIDEPLPYYFSFELRELLLNMIKRAKLSNGFAHSTFEHIEITLADKLRDFKGNDFERSWLNTAIFSLKYTAISYFEEYLVEEFKDVHVAEILSKVKNTLAQTNEHFGRYFREALLSIKKNIERRIELQKEEKLNRSQIYEPQEFNENHGAKTENLKKHKDLNRERATLFINYLLDFAKEKSRENYGLKNKKLLKDADKDRIIDFLTPFAGTQSKKLHKGFKDEIAKIAEIKEVSEKFYQDMQTIRKYFEMLGLSEIINKIDADLGEK